MTGEDLLKEIRRYSTENGVNSYVFANKALREYCRTTGFTWLKEVADAGFQIGPTPVGSNTFEIPLGDLGFRSIRRLWIQSVVDGGWYPLDELKELEFELRLNERLSAGGQIDVTSLSVPSPPDTVFVTGQQTGSPANQDIPRYYNLSGRNGQLWLRFAPLPDQAYNGRIDGVAETPVLQRLSELPGPREYHDLVAELAAGYILQDDGLLRLRRVKSTEDIQAAQAITAAGDKMVAKSLNEIYTMVVRDSEPNRMTDVAWAGQRLRR